MSGRVTATRSRMKETVVCVWQYQASRVLRLIPLCPAQSDASQEAERLTDDWTSRSADVPNLSYGQFVLFYSFIALANWRRTRQSATKASVKRALFLLIIASGIKRREEQISTAFKSMNFQLIQFFFFFFR